MELGQIFVRTNLRNWPKNLQWRQRKLLSAVREVTSTGISIITSRNEGLPTFCLCLTTGRHLGLHSGRRKAARRRNCRPPISGLAIVQFRQYVKTHATTNVCLHMSLLTAMRLSIIRSFTLPQTGYRLSIHHVRSNDWKHALSQQHDMYQNCYCGNAIVKCQRGNVVNAAPIVV